MRRATVTRCLSSPAPISRTFDSSVSSITVQATDGPTVTTIDGGACTLGGSQCSVVLFVDNEGFDSVLSGFRLTGGTGTLYDATNRRGGGVYCNQSSPMIDDCIVTGNTAYNGGGVSAYISSSPLVTNCTIDSNVSTNCGGGVDNRQSNITLENCSITNNSAVLCGGGLAAMSVVDRP